MTDARTTVVQGGRAKAYRPLDDAARRSAFLAGIAAYERGEFFAAHELLEPAWMGTADVAERDLHQGLIKLAAGYVHAVRGNPQGMMKNLRGARDRLAAAAATGMPAIGRAALGGHDLDLPALIVSIDARLATLARTATVGPIDPPVLARRHS
jgi:predicted metal-dependent hydrolase